MDVVKIFQGAMTLLVALAWNQAAKTTINSIYPMPEQQVKAELIYALTITLIIIFLVYLHNYAYNTLNSFHNFVDRVTYAKEGYHNGLITETCYQCGCCQRQKPCQLKFKK